MNHLVSELSALQGLARQLIDQVGDQKERRIVCLHGEIGAGKTTFVKAVCEVLGVEEPVTSPTYSIINEYRYTDAQGEEQPLYHLDLYRLKNQAEALDLGLEELLDEGAWCFIEWPEIIGDWLPEAAVKISFEIVDDSTRKILFL